VSKHSSKFDRRKIISHEKTENWKLRRKVVQIKSYFFSCLRRIPSSNPINNKNEASTISYSSCTMKWLETFKSSSEQRWRLLFDDARIHGWSRISRIVILSRADGTSRRFIRFLHSFDVWYMAFSWIDVKPLLIWIISLRRRSSDDVHSSRGHRNGSRPMVIPYNTTPLSVVNHCCKFKHFVSRDYNYNSHGTD